MRITETQITLHITSTLTHAMHFRLFQMKVLVQCGPTNHCSDREDTLSSYACQDYIFLFHTIIC